MVDIEPAIWCPINRKLVPEVKKIWLTNDNIPGSMGILNEISYRYTVSVPY